MHPGPGRDGTRRDECSQRHCPPRQDPRPWDGPGQPNSTRTAPAPVPRRPIIGLPAGRLKDASGAATAAGLRPVLDPAAARHGHGSYRETGDASHARPARQPEPAKPPLTRPRSFRDE